MKTLLRKLESRIPWANLSNRHLKSSGGEPLSEVEEGADINQPTLPEIDLSGHSFKGCTLYAPSLKTMRFRDNDFGGAHIYQGQIDSAQFNNCDFSATTLSMVDLENTAIEDSTLLDSRVSGCNLRGASLNNCDLRGSLFSLTDFFGGHWQSLNANETKFWAVDASFVHLKQVTLTGADLRGSNFSYCTFEEVNLSGVLCHGADFRGVKGLSEEQRLHLLKGGARLRSGPLEDGLARFLTAILPQTTLERVDSLARLSSWTLQGLLIMAMLALTLVMFQERVVPEGAAEQMGDGAVILKHDPTDREIEQSKASLAKLNQAIQDAYIVTKRYGIAAYPTLEDLSNNLFDRDGLGTGTDKVILVEGGLPPNLLTLGDAILPYCNDVPNQETLSGDDSDWHYCPETGRLFACGGFTEHATLEW